MEPDLCLRRGAVSNHCFYVGHIALVSMDKNPVWMELVLSTSLLRVLMQGQAQALQFDLTKIELRQIFAW